MRKLGVAEKGCEAGAGHVQGQQDSGEVCSRSDKWVQGKGRVTPVTSPEPLLVCSGDGQVDR